MTKLTQHTSVNCPLPQAAQRLESFFRAHGNAAGDTARIRLQANVAPPGAPEYTVERPVIATMQLRYVDGDMEPRYRIQWAPEGGGPYPLFAGELTIGGEDDYDSFRLTLSGAYEPPLGLAGAAFDAVAGHTIAERAASRLLAEIKTAIEAEFRSAERAKSEHAECMPSD
jgi:hypothetical protein